MIDDHRSANGGTENGVLHASIGLAAAALLIFGLGYSLAGTAIGGFAFPAAANGSILVRDGRFIGSVLVAQPFASEWYFHSRPSAAGYNPMAVAGSNQSRGNAEMRNRLKMQLSAVAALEGVEPASVPSDMVAMSGSGIDPHLSPASAQLQVARVSRARRLDPRIVQALLERHIVPPQFGVLGKARVNVLLLNLGLDSIASDSGKR